MERLAVPHLNRRTHPWGPDRLCCLSCTRTKLLPAKVGKTHQVRLPSFPCLTKNINLNFNPEPHCFPNRIASRIASLPESLCSRDLQLGTSLTPSLKPPILRSPQSHANPGCSGAPTCPSRRHLSSAPGRGLNVRWF